MYVFRIMCMFIKVIKNTIKTNLILGVLMFTLL